MEVLATQENQVAAPGCGIFKNRYRIRCNSL